MRSFRLGDQPSVNATRLGRCRLEWERDGCSRRKTDGTADANDSAAPCRGADSRREDDHGGRVPGWSGGLDPNLACATCISGRLPLSRISVNRMHVRRRPRAAGQHDALAMGLWMIWTIMVRIDAQVEGAGIFSSSALPMTTVCGSCGYRGRVQQVPLLTCHGNKSPEGASEPHASAHARCLRFADPLCSG